MAYHKSPEAPKRTFRDRKQPPRSLALPCFSSLLYIPNTAEVAYYGMLSGFKKYLNETKIEQIANLDHVPSKEELYEILEIGRAHV